MKGATRPNSPGARHKVSYGSNKTNRPLSPASPQAHEHAAQPHNDDNKDKDNNNDAAAASGVDNAGGEGSAPQQQQQEERSVSVVLRGEVLERVEAWMAEQEDGKWSVEAVVLEAVQRMVGQKGESEKARADAQRGGSSRASSPPKDGALPSGIPRAPPQRVSAEGKARSPKQGLVRTRSEGAHNNNSNNKTVRVAHTSPPPHKPPAKHSRSKSLGAMVHHKNPAERTHGSVSPLLPVNEQERKSSKPSLRRGSMNSASHAEFERMVGRLRSQDQAEQQLGLDDLVRLASTNPTGVDAQLRRILLALGDLVKSERHRKAVQHEMEVIRALVESVSEAEVSRNIALLIGPVLRRLVGINGKHLKMEVAQVMVALVEHTDSGELLAALTPHMEDSNPVVRAFAARVSHQVFLAKSIDPGAACVQRIANLLQALASDASPDTRTAAANALAALDDLLQQG